MESPPIPQRIPPLAWRKPALLWIPLALALAIGGAYALFLQDDSIARALLIAAALVYALALGALSTAWALGRAPRSHREVVLYVLGAALIVALAAPYGLSALIGAQVKADKHAVVDLALALAPLAVLLGLPLALLSGLIFSLTALTRPRAEKPLELTEDDARFAHQPFN